MTMWKKTSTGLCKFCLNSQTLQQVVSGCKVYLHEGRYNWRHDSILKNLVTYFKSIRGNLKYYVDIPGFEPSSVITGEERRPDIVIRDTNKLYIIELTVGFKTRISINAERKLKHYENLGKELSQGFESVMYVNLSMGALGLMGKGSKKYCDLLKMTLKLEKDQTNYLIKKIMSCCIRTAYYIFCKKDKSWDKPDVLSLQLRFSFLFSFKLFFLIFNCIFIVP